MVDPQKSLEREALLRRHRDIQAELAQIERNREPSLSFLYVAHRRSPSFLSRGAALDTSRGLVLLISPSSRRPDAF